jgi:Toprim domain
MNMRALARALAGEPCGRNRVLCPGPGHSKADRSLSVIFNGGAGPVVHSFAGDDWRLCKNHVRALLGGAAYVWSTPQQRERDRDDERTAIARTLWSQGIDPRGTPAEDYLRSRGLTLTDAARKVLRFHPHPKYPAGWGPTLLAAFQHIETDEITGIHRIRVDRPRLWPRTRRKMLGPVAGSAVKLADVPDGVLAVGEGIETCMAANALGFGPAWALGSAGAIATLPVLEDIRKLILLGENDDASRKATDDCAERWLRAGREVEFVEPEVGKDLNDELMGSR